MKQFVSAFLIAIAAAAVSPAWAQGNPADVTDMQALRTALRTDKKAYVGHR